MNYTLESIYKEYIKDHESIDKKIFRDLCESFNIEVIEDILEGQTFNMGSNLSSLSIVKMERDPRNPKIDWGESNKYKKELLEQGEALYDSTS